jgi:hypothetical protein
VSPDAERDPPQIVDESRFKKNGQSALGSFFQSPTPGSRLEPDAAA